jgi:hypothetical protein
MFIFNNLVSIIANTNIHINECNIKLIKSPYKCSNAKSSSGKSFLIANNFSLLDLNIIALVNENDGIILSIHIH